jgi:hypothetical protein
MCCSYLLPDQFPFLELSHQHHAQWETLEIDAFVEIITRSRSTMGYEMKCKISRMFENVRWINESIMFRVPQVRFSRSLWMEAHLCHDYRKAGRLMEISWQAAHFVETQTLNVDTSFEEWPFPSNKFHSFISDMWCDVMWNHIRNCEQKYREQCTKSQIFKSFSDYWQNPVMSNN